MAGWTWCVIGLVLFVIELALPSGFFLFFLGISGLIVGLVSFTGVALSWPIQAVVFCGIAVVLWFAFASKMRKAMRRDSDDVAGDTSGKIVKVTGAVAPGEIGSGELWGSSWRIKNVDTRPLAVGSDAVVVHSEGVTLHVRSNA